MKTIAFFGSSNLIGVGYPDGIASKDIFPNIIARQGYNIQNHGIAGATIYEIFLTCLDQLVQSPPDIVFIDWNMAPRYRFHPSPETEVYMSGSGITTPNNWSHCIPISKKQLLNCQETLLLLDGDYHRMLTLMTYCKIIEDICKLKNISLVMVNGGGMPWTPDLFAPYNDNSDLWSALSNYSKELLRVNDRSDSEILNLLSHLNQQFNSMDLKNWIWIFESIPMLCVDYAQDNIHPGPETMKIIAKRIINFLKEKNL
jgi:lysophospholipase L1-like esterase